MFQPPSATGIARARSLGPRGAPGQVGVGMRAATGVVGSLSQGSGKMGGEGWAAGSCSLGSGMPVAGVMGASWALRGAASGAKLETCKARGGGVRQRWGGSGGEHCGGDAAACGFGALSCDYAPATGLAGPSLCR